MITNGSSRCRRGDGRGSGQCALPGLRIGIVEPLAVENPKIVSERLGHATVAFTLGTYTDDVPELHHAAAEAVSSLFLEADTEEPATSPEDAMRDEDDQS